MNWIAENPWIAWIAIALVLAAIEAITADFMFLMLSGGALAGGIAAGVGGNIYVQVAVAIVIAMVLLFGVRPPLKQHFMSGQYDTHIGASGLVGREARVLQSVTATSGRVKLAGETWSARLADGSPSLAPGEVARVIEIQGATVVVAAPPEPGDTVTATAPMH